MALSVLIPIKEPESWLANCYERLQKIGKKYPKLIGEICTNHDKPLSVARRNLALIASNPFICNLDADTMLPIDYLHQALFLLERNANVGAVALNYKPISQGHLAFGTSVMRRSVMLTHYDWKDLRHTPPCECVYMWRKLHKLGYLIVTLPYTAEHKRAGVIE